MDRQAEALPNGIRIRGNSIQIDFYYNGVRYREALKLIPNAKNIKYASKMKDAILFDIERNQFDYAKYFPKSKKLKVATEQKSEILFLDIINKQSELYKRRYNNGKMSISTWKGYEKSINGHLIPMFGKLLLKDITPLLIRNWLYTFTNRSKTITNILIPLKAALKNAIKDGLINENPADKVDVADIIKDIGLPKKEVIDPFTQEEKKAIIKAAHEQVKNLIQFGFWSGLRTGELIALRWSDIDFEAGLINVTKNIVFGEEKQPKTRSGIRSVLMLPNAREALTAQFLHTGFAGDFVFHNPHTNKRWYSDAKIRLAWIKILEEAKVRYRYPYQMRHTYASTLLSNGENPAWIATQLGHINMDMVIKVYGKWIPNNNFMGGYQLKGDY